ncbi:MAG: competence/damage-inducible protein A [Candidatus Marinimicrobia bacterium]|nr:competence/damage-inducible protein A [Candidatus Neomarinimicrobiota bacterium]
MGKSAEIIAIGDEVLAGHTLDTNSHWISNELRRIGIKTTSHHTIADEEKSIVCTLDNIQKNTDFIFITGGLGPTRDDITKRVITKYFDGKLIFHKEILDELKEYFAKIKKKFPNTIDNMLYYPDNAELLDNKKGNAKGMLFEKENQKYFVMPGVPHEMKFIMENQILPKLKKNTKITYQEFTIITTGICEADLIEKIEFIFEKYPSVILSYYPSIEGVKIRIGQNIKNGNSDLLECKKKLLSVLGNLVYSEKKEDITEIIANLLLEKKLTLSIAESCTGGLISHRITQNSGSSKYFKEGIVVYSNEAKMKYLDVKKETLEKFGAVSKETVLEMVSGMRKVSGTDIAIAITGIAGPTGGTETKPVGLVWIGISTKNKTYAKKIIFDKGRELNKKYSAQRALDILRLELLSMEN